METNEIMENEEVIETTEEIAKAGSGKGLKIAAGVGLTVLVGGLLCKYVVMPAIAKYKVRKAEQQAINAEDDCFDTDSDTIEEVDEQ